MDLSQSIGPCPFCRSLNYHRTDTGFFVCEYGHQSQTVWQEEQDDYDTNVGVGRRIKRQRIRTSSQQPEESYEDPSVVYLGNVDRYRVFLAVQYVLYAQCKALKTFLQLNSEFEMLTKNIWFALVAASGLEYDEERLDIVDDDGGGGGGEGVDNGKSDASSNTEKGQEDMSSDISEIDLFEEEEDSDLCPELSTPSWAPTLRRTKPQLPKSYTPATGLVIIYLALIEMGVPILIADIKRLVLDGILPCFGTLSLLPFKVRRPLEKKHWDILFKGNFWSLNGTEKLESLTRQIAYNISIKEGGSIRLRSLNLSGILRRFIIELSLPFCFESMISKLLSKMMKTLFNYSDSTNDYTPHPQRFIAAAIVFFLKIHYSLDIYPSPSKQTSSNVIMSRLGLPTSRQLVEIWLNKEAKLCDFSQMPRRSSMNWNELSDYLSYLDRVGLTKKSNEGSSGGSIGSNVGTEPKSYESLYVFPDDPPPNWQAIHLNDDQRKQLANMPKSWTFSWTDRIEELSSDYLLLLKLTSTIIDCSIKDLLYIVHGKFEKSLNKK